MVFDTQQCVSELFVNSAHFFLEWKTSKPDYCTLFFWSHYRTGLANNVKKKKSLKIDISKCSSKKSIQMRYNGKRANDDTGVATLRIQTLYLGPPGIWARLLMPQEYHYLSLGLQILHRLTPFNLLYSNPTSLLNLFILKSGYTVHFQ